MIPFIKDFVAWHWTTATRLLRLTPIWIWVMPFVAMGALLLLNKVPFIEPILLKPRAEVMGPIITLVGTCYAAYLAWSRPDVPYYKWQTILGAMLFLRELHFWGTNDSFIVGLALMIWWASSNRERMQPYMFDRRIVTLMVGTLWIYFVSQLFDWYILDNMLPKATEDLFEENMENIGHLMFVAQVIISGTMSPSDASAGD